MTGRGLDRWRPRWALVMALTALMQVALAGCSSEPAASGALVAGTVIDHYTLGAPLDCATYSDGTCDEYLRIAIATATTQHGVAPAAIIGHRFYRESIPGTVDGGSSVGIVVLDLADGSRVAVGVHCVVGPCEMVTR